MPGELAARADVLGCPVDRLTLDQAVTRCEVALRDGVYLQQFSANAAKVVALREDRLLAQLSQAAGMVNPDGISVVWASRLLGDPLPQRVTGIDLMQRLLGVAARDRHRVYLLGASGESLDQATARLAELHPSLELAGTRNGFFDDSENAGVCEAIRAAKADILFVAMGSPRSEHWMLANGADLGVKVVIGVGGSIDVLAGRVRRAPQLFQQLGLEWLYRLVQEPRRLIGRNLVSFTFWRMALGARLRRGD